MESSIEETRICAEMIDGAYVTFQAQNGEAVWYRAIKTFRESRLKRIFLMETFKKLALSWKVIMVMKLLLQNIWDSKWLFLSTMYVFCLFLLGI